MTNNPTTPVCVECGKEKATFGPDGVGFSPTTDICHCQPKEEAKAKCCDKQFVWSGGEGTSHYCCNVHCCVPVQPKEEAKGERCEKCGLRLVYGDARNAFKPASYCNGACAPTNPKKEDWEAHKWEGDFRRLYRKWDLPMIPNGTVDHSSKYIEFISRLLAEARREGVKDATDKLWHALLFGSSCHQVKIEGASSYPCVCCAASVKAVGEAIDRVKPESRKE